MPTTPTYPDAEWSHNPVGSPVYQHQVKDADDNVIATVGTPEFGEALCRLPPPIPQRFPDSGGYWPALATSPQNNESPKRVRNAENIPSVVEAPCIACRYVA